MVHYLNTSTLYQYPINGAPSEHQYNYCPYIGTLSEHQYNYCPYIGALSEHQYIIHTNILILVHYLKHQYTIYTNIHISVHYLNSCTSSIPISIYWCIIWTLVHYLYQCPYIDALSEHQYIPKSIYWCIIWISVHYHNLEVYIHEYKELEAPFQIQSVREY